MYIVEFWYGGLQEVECTTFSELENMVWGIVLAGIDILGIYTEEE